MNKLEGHGLPDERAEFSNSTPVCDAVETAVNPGYRMNKTTKFVYFTASEPANPGICGSVEAKTDITEYLCDYYKLYQSS